MLLGSINKNVSACSNFYDYVCGQWPIQNPRPDSYEVWADHQAMELEELRQLKNFLDTKDKSAPDNEDLKELYQMCMKLPYLHKSPPDVISQQIEIVGNWPMFLPKKVDIPVPWSVIDDKYIQITGRSALFDLHLIKRGKEEERCIVPQLKPLFSPYGSIVRSNDWGLISSQLHYYKAYLYRIIGTLTVTTSSVNPMYSYVPKDVEEVINFREKLRQMIDKLPGENSEGMTIKEFQELFNKEASKVESAKMDWSLKVTDIYNILKDPRFHSKNNSLVTVDKTYLLNLISILKKTPNRVIANHIHLYFVERHLALNSKMQEELLQTCHNGTSTHTTIRKNPPRWNWCLQQHNLQRTLRKVYLEAFFPPTRKTEVEKLFEEAKSLVKQQISESTWLDSNMTEKSLAKISSMRSVIGDALPATSDGVRAIALDPLKSDIQYLRKENAVCVAAASIRAPLYDLNAPYVIQYGATVAVFGHEVYHVFNRNTLKYDCYGQKWWPSAMRKKFKGQVKCFEAQYEQKRAQELRNHGIPNIGLFPDTIPQDISDVMGVKAAYKGYKQTFEKSKGVCPVLPGFEKTSCDKLFFIAFARNLCSDHSDAAKRRQLFNDEHSTSRVRVNGIASNIEEFGTAFGCKPTDPMMQEKRCDIWKN